MLNSNNKSEIVPNIYYRIMSRYNIVWSFAGIFFAVLGCFKKVPKNVDYLFLCHDVHRNAKKNGKLYAPLIDPIIEGLNKNYKCVTLVTPFSRHYGNNCFGDVRMHNFVVLIALLKRALLRTFGTNRGIENDPLVLAYKGLLNEIRPKLVIGIQPSIEFCVAAKQLGIITCDMQHGLISDVNYYAVVKREKINQQGWPDHILCWDEPSVDRVNKITKGNSCPYMIGNPSYHSMYSAELHLADSTDSQQRKREFKMEILVTATYHDYGAFFEDEGYQNIGISNRLINVIKQSPHVFWRIRLHPVLVRFHFDHVSSLLRNEFKNCENVDWIKYSHIPLGKAFSGCLGHITVDSASALDAAQNSIPTLLLGLPGVSGEEKANLYFGEYIELGIMKFVNAPNFSAHSLDFFLDFSLNNSNKNIKASGSQEFSKFMGIIKNNNVLESGQLVDI